MDIVAKGKLEVWTEPQVLYPELPDRLALYAEQGMARIEIPFMDGSYIFMRSGAHDEGNNACFTIPEFEELVDYMTAELVKAKQLAARYGPLEHEG